MSIEKAIISRSQPFAISSIVKSIIEIEAKKGCSSEIFPYSVKLEPNYLNPANWISNPTIIENQSFVIEDDNSYLTKVLTCWMPPEHNLEWYRAERFIKILKGARKRICFEIIGNSERIDVRFRISEQELDLLKIAFDGEYSECEITQIEAENKFEGNIFFFDYFPPPPYHHLFTRSKELNTSAFEPLIIALSNISDDRKGFVQVIFEPVRNNWHKNVEILNDLEFISNIVNDPRSQARVKQQVPSTDLRNMARDVESKAHNDKPFYSVAIRAGIITKEDDFEISGLTSFMNLFQHGGNPLSFITQNKYSEVFTKYEIKEMLEDCKTYRPGFLLNSAELSGIVHLPSMSKFFDQKLQLNYLENPLTVVSEELRKGGIRIGNSRYAGTNKEVKINNSIRKTGIHIIGRSGSGKTTLLENMILQDIENSTGLAVIDPHGDMVKRLLKIIPKDKVESTIYLDFGSSEFIPVWNPIKRIPNQSIERVSEDLVGALKSIIKSNAWGDRLEHLLRNGFIGLLHIDDSTLYDLLILFEQSRSQSKEKRILTNMIKSVISNPVAKRFWDKDFASYKRDDFTPPHHKLSKLLNTDESVSLMFSQPNSYINFSELMENNKTILLDLSNVGTESRKILGSFLISILHNTVISRNKFKETERKSFSIYCDEAHKFTPDTLEDMITDARKFGINLTFAHQFLNQFNTQQRDALLSSGNTIIFNVDMMDARLLVNNLQGKVEVKDIVTLQTGEAFARIGTDIIKLETDYPTSLIQGNIQEEIKKLSREKYCMPINEVKRTISERLKQFGIEMQSKEIISQIEFSNDEDFEFDYDIYD